MHTNMSVRWDHASQDVSVYHIYKMSLIQSWGGVQWRHCNPASLPGEETPICASRHEKGAILAKDYHLHAISMAPQLINLSIPGYLATNSTQDFAHIT